jgi:hypothetical protein
MNGYKIDTLFCLFNRGFVARKSIYVIGMTIDNEKQTREIDKDDMTIKETKSTDHCCHTIEVHRYDIDDDDFYRFDLLFTYDEYFLQLK